MKLRSARVFGRIEKSRQKVMYIRMDSTLHKAIKRLAAKQNRSVNSLAIDLFASEVWAQKD